MLTNDVNKENSLDENKVISDENNEQKSNEPEKEHTPLVSILIPVYKVEQYLEECLDSLVNQTLKDIEIVCVNDGSPDGSAKILERYKELDPRIVIVNKENGGLPSARNAGLDVARGKYVGFVDSDDYVEPNMFERLYETAEKENSEIVICGAKIFPLNPQPSNWLYEVLSPPDKTYREFSPELIFSEPSSRPFIWRTFIKRDLIERNHLRLQEDILVGEDNAFQFRIYPLAKGVTLISDKLYDYRWYREGSMMNSGVYDNMTKRVKCHAELVKHIATKWLETNEMCKMEYEFLKWSVEFLYDDFIKIPLNDKIEIAKELTPVWDQCAYYINKTVMPVYLVDMFEYFFECAKETPMTPKLSIIIPVGSEVGFFAQNVNGIMLQSLKELEVIFINCGANDDTYAFMHKMFHKHKNIRMFNQGSHILSESFNIGIQLAEGEYMTFLLPNDWYNKNMLEKWYEKAASDKCDVCGSLYQEANSRYHNPVPMLLANKGDEDSYYLDSDFKNILYKKEFISENKLKFEDCSILTGTLFLAKVYALKPKSTLFEKAVYMHRLSKEKSKISIDECKKLLNCIKELLRISLKNNDSLLHTKAIALLNDDYMHKLIIESVKKYLNSRSADNSDITPISKIWISLMTISSLVSPEFVSKSSYADVFTALPHIISSFVEINHKWLAELSNQYKDRP